MLPTVGNETPKIIWYAAEVAGRIYGVALMENLVPDPDKRAALKKSADAIQKEVMDSRGAKDAAYIRRVIKVQRSLELGSRAVLLFSGDVLLAEAEDKIRISKTGKVRHKRSFCKHLRSHKSPTRLRRLSGAR